MQNLRKNKKGFTLIELVVVIVILGILALIAIPSLSNFRQQAQVATCQANQRTAESEFALAKAQGKTDAEAQTAVTATCPADNSKIAINITAGATYGKGSCAATDADTKTAHNTPAPQN